jgi:hypothetical protein
LNHTWFQALTGFSEKSLNQVRNTEIEKDTNRLLEFRDRVEEILCPAYFALTSFRLLPLADIRIRPSQGL